MHGVEPRRFSRGEYERMGRAGIFAPDERVELIDGEIVRMPPQGRPHARGILAAEEALRRIIGPDCHIQVRMPLALDLHSEPEPDIAVIRGSWRDYAEDHPSSAVLVVEVADSTVEYDRKWKGSLYARARVSDFWLVNLPERRLEVYRSPAESRGAAFGWAFASVMVLRTGERVSPLAFPESSIPVDALVG